MRIKNWLSQLRQTHGHNSRSRNTWLRRQALHSRAVEGLETRVLLTTFPQVDSWLKGAPGQYAEAVNGFDTAAGPSTTFPNFVPPGATYNGGVTTPEIGDIQRIKASANWVYVETGGLASYVMGPWFNGNGTVFPNFPADQNLTFRVPRSPSIPATKTVTPMGAIGLYVNGVAMFNALDGFSYDTATGQDLGSMAPPGQPTGDGIWQRDANFAEKVTFDHSNAHQPDNGEYHYHSNPVALRTQLNDNIEYTGQPDLFPYEDVTTGTDTHANDEDRNYEELTTNLHHSPIIGWSKDGFPVYGPYGYSNPNDTSSPIVRMQSNYRLRNITQRHSLDDWAAKLHFGGNVVLNAQGEYDLPTGQWGPDVSPQHPLGAYIEDYETVDGQGTLDVFNGRYAKTPEFPNGTYAYFLSIDAAGEGSFPYAIGPAYFGSPTGGRVTSITEPVTTVFDVVNGAPTISDIVDQSTNEDTPTAAIGFIVGDDVTPATSLSVSATSSNTALIPNGNILLGGSGSSRTITLSPAPNAFGTATITVSVTDSTGGTTSDTFVLTVSPINDLPVISDITDRTTTSGTSTGAISFTVGDLETPAAALTVSGQSSNTTLVPNANIVFGGSGENRTVTVTPAPGKTGTATIYVTVNDGTASSSDSFVLTVTSAPNTPPVISDIKDLSTTKNTTTSVINFTVGDTETALGSLVVTASSSNTSLLPNPNIILGGTGGDRTIFMTPANNLTGTATVTVTVTDGSGATATDTFVLTVNSVPNANPKIANVSDITINEDTASPVIPFAITDVETPTSLLGVTATSSNLALIPANGITLAGSGGNRTVTVRPAPNKTGKSTITLTVTDTAGSTASDTFDVIVAPVNDLPVISNIIDRTIDEDGSAVLTFSISDIETEAGVLSLSVASSNANLLPIDRIQFGGSGGGRSVMVAPLPNQSGSSTVTVTVTDADGGTSSDSFVLTVNPVNDPPRIADIPDILIAQDTVSAPIPFNVGDIESAPGTLTLAAASSNAALIPVAGIQFGGSGGDRTVTVAPAPGQFGTATITVTVKDGVLTASDTFVVTVTPDTESPTISDIRELTIAEDSTPAPINFVIGDQQTAVGDLLVRATSSNPNLVPDGNLVIGGSGSNRTLSLSPLPNQFGTATITVTVTDTDGRSRSDTFALNVTPVNDLPTITSIDDITIDEDGNRVVNFTVGDLETLPANLMLSARSSNTAVLPATRMTFGGSGVNRTLTLTPAANIFGTTAITVTVTDANGGSATEPFQFTINSVNDRPVLQPIGNQIISEDRDVVVGLALGDVETLPDQLLVTASSSNADLFPNGNLVIAGTGTSRTLTATPLPNANGSATITVTVTDGDNVSTSQAFSITVNSVNDAPTISPVADQTIEEDGSLPPLNVTIGDPDSSADGLVLSVATSNPALIPSSNIVLGGSGTTRTIALTPTANGFGDSIITLTVRDNTGLQSQAAFKVTVLPMNDSVPVAGDDTFAVARGGMTPVLSVLGNDTDADLPNDLLTIGTELVTQPLHGRVTLDFHGYIQYQNNGDPGATDSFQYRLLDDAGHQAIGTVTINLQNSPPSAQAGGPYQIAPGQDLRLDAGQSRDPDSDPLSFKWFLNGDDVADVTTSDAAVTVPWTRLVELGLRPGFSGPIGLEVTSTDGTAKATSSLAIGTVFEFRPIADGNADQYVILQTPNGLDIRRPEGTQPLTPPGLVNLTQVVVVGSNDPETFTLPAQPARLNIVISGNGGADATYVLGSDQADVITLTNIPNTADRVGVGAGPEAARLQANLATEDIIVAGGLGNDVLDARPVTAPTSVRLTLAGQDGNDQLWGGVGNDVLSGDLGDDFAQGGPGNDIVRGGAGADSLAGGDGNDLVQGQGGSKDTVSGGGGNDTLDGGAGADFMAEAGNVNFTLTDVQLTGLGTDQLIDLEAAQLSGGPGNNLFDAARFTKGPVTLLGNAGNDTLIGSVSGDVVQGGLGDDVLKGGPGNDALQGNDGADILIGGAGNDSLDGGGGNDGLSGQDGDDVLIGNIGDDTLIGGAGKDSLQGGLGNDIALGKGDADIVDGGDGTDTIAGGSGSGADLGDQRLGPASEINEAFVFTANWIDAI